MPPISAPRPATARIAALHRPGFLPVAAFSLLLAALLMLAAALPAAAQGAALAVGAEQPQAEVTEDAASAEDEAQTEGAQEEAEAPSPLDSVGPFPAGTLELSEFQWRRQVLAVFADTPHDPAYQRQLEFLHERLDALDTREVTILLDSAPADATPLRHALRPRGFAIVIVGEDGRVLQRRPNPLSVRDITRLIDSTSQRNRP